MESAGEVQKRVAEQRQEEKDIAGARSVHRFKIPKKLANGITDIGMIQLNSEEELRATKRARNDTHRLAYELSQQALVEVNGQKVSEGDGTREKAWASMDPKVRTLVITAYGELHAPEADDIDDFLKSQRVTVS